jgi:hypothetical protein
VDEVKKGKELKERTRVNIPSRLGSNLRANTASVHNKIGGWSPLMAKSRRA